ncbi:MAG TPA: phospholipase D-like domain-containing protein [Candidatus Polarisedimenticolia bacterium]|nr:phospholipase D-like domain-containing protein [Candidatus Polarisedimenticolia bacterium]
MVVTLDFVAALLTSAHTLLNKRDSRAATLWLGIIWFLPIFGPMLYLGLGVNRIRRRAISLGVRQTVVRPIPSDLGETQSSAVEHLEMLARVVSRVIKKPLSPDNHLQALVDGDQAFPAMLAAIDAAKKSISLVSYIFDNDATGKQFVDALARAVKRGVQVRVLIDAAGIRYSWPPITHRLRHAKIPVAKFLPASVLTPWRVTTINLRNHRKVLVVDGETAFTGGMNIRHGNVLAENPKSPVRDLHFRVEGPVVAQLQEAFASDWAFTTDEVLEGDLWFPELPDRGSTVARVIPDGPDADFEMLRWTLLAALSEAQTSVQILTPYFLPDSALVTAMNLAALRGVRVDIILPARSNLRFVDWASRGMWWQVLERGCRIWLTRPPFDHSKLMIVDGHWVLLGSANWDARSLRLNFELNLEAYGRNFAEQMGKIIEEKLRGAREVTLEDADARSYAAKLRDAVMRLFSPYL